MACSSPKKRAVSNLLALVDQSEGLKTNARRKEERRRRAAREKFPTWRGIQISSVNIINRLISVSSQIFLFFCTNLTI